MYLRGESIWASKTAHLCLSHRRPSIRGCLGQTSMTLLPHITLKAREASKILASLDKKII
jgi:hypothetical protein